MQRWLQRLALLLPIGCGRVHLPILLDQLPVPECVIRHYGALINFINAQQGVLSWDNTFRSLRYLIVLEPAAHQSLRAAGEAADREEQAVQAEVTRWFQQLALLLPIPHAPIHLKVLLKQLPLPDRVNSHYSSVRHFLCLHNKVIRWAPALRDHVVLVEAAHRSLLAAATAASPAAAAAAQ